MEQITTDELTQQMANQLQENTPVQTIREWAAIKGFTPQQIDVSLDGARTIVQQRAEKDPTLRLILGPALLIIAFVGFYTDWSGRSVGVGSVIGVIMLLLGGRLVWSLVKQYAKK